MLLPLQRSYMLGTKPGISASVGVGGVMRRGMTEQPQGPVSFDRTNSLTDQLIDGFLPRGARYWSVAETRAHVQSGPVVGSVNSRWGVAATSWGNNFIQCPRSAPNTSDSTVLVVARTTTTLLDGALVASFSQQSNGANSMGLSTADGTNAGRIMGIGHIGGAARSWGGSVVLQPGDDFIAVVRHKTNSFQDLWLNGVQDPVIGNITGTNLSYSHFGRRASSTPTYLALAWARCLNDREVAEISRNPWQVFARPASKIWVPA